MKQSILMTTEGTYPYVRGGVGTWCNDMVTGLRAHDFYIYAITGVRYDAYMYSIPDNVKKIVTVPLWDRQILSKTKKTVLETPQENNITEKFLEPFLYFIGATHDQELNRKMCEESVVALYRYFQKYNYEVTLSSPVVWDVFSQHLDSIVFNNECRASLHDKRYLLTFLVRSLAAFRLPVDKKASVIHGTAAGWSGVCCMTNKVVEQKPYILSEHGVYLREQFYFIEQSQLLTQFQKKYLQRIVRRLVAINYLLADVVVPVCEFNSRWEASLGVKPEVITTIYNGIKIDFALNKVRKSSRGAPIMVVSAVYSLKDIKTIIAAMKILKRSKPQLVVHIYGRIIDQKYYKECLNMVREQQLEGTVFFMGIVQDLAQRFVPGGIFLMSSLSEGFPYSILEAMARKQAIITTAVGGIKEALGECGRYVSVKDPESLAQHCRELIADESLRVNLGESAFKRASELFTIEAMLNEYEKLYHQAT